MKKMKKMLAFLLATTMTASLLAGCGGGGGNSESGSGITDSASGSDSTSGDASGGSSDTTVTSVGEYSADNPYHLVFAFVEFSTQDDAARDAVEAALNEYMIPNYHIEVEFLPLQYADYQTSIQLMISGGDELDVLPIYYTMASSWIGMNGLVDMTPYMDTEDGQKIIDAIGEENAYVGSMGDFLFGFPAMKESVELGGLCMRADICDELGITEEFGLKANDDQYTGKVYDWSVATEIFAKVKEAHPEMVPLYLQGSASPMRRFAFFDELADQFGVLDWEADHSSTTVVNEFETDTYRDAVTLLAEWYDAGYIYQDAATDTQGSGTMMKAGNTFSYTTAIKPGFLVEAEASNGCDCYVIYFGQDIEGGYSTTNVSFYDTGIASNSADPEMAFKFIAALYSDPAVMNFWQYGIEGTNYQVLDDGTAYFVDGEDAANYKYHQNSGWFMGNQFNSYVWNDGSKTADYWDTLSHHNDWAEYSPAYGFMWDSSDYQTQLTALQNALNTYRPALETGSVGVANVDTYLKQLNDALYAAGLQQVMDAKQEQLDAWLAENGATETPASNMELIESVTTGVLTEPTADAVGSSATTDDGAAAEDTSAAAEDTSAAAETTADTSAETEAVEETAAE